MPPFRNVTKRDLFHGIANRKEHYKKELKRETRPLKSEVSSTVKLSDIVNLEQFIKENITNE